MNPHTNKPHVPLLFRHIRLLLCGVGSALSCLYAQSDASAVKADDEVVSLPQFTVNSELDDSFIGKEAMSTTRTGVELADLAQSVVVVNKEFINDIHPEYIADIMKFVGGGQVGTLTWTGSTRYTMRGFTSEGDFTDGFLMPSGNTNFNYVDHVEVIKGPSAIFVTNSANTVGGMVNKISKTPTSHHVGTLTVEAALFDRGGADLDVGGAITADKKLQYRVLLSAVDFDRYYDNGYDKRWSVMPMLSYDFSPNTQAWIKMEKFEQHFSSYNGIALDGRTGKMADVPRSNNLNEDYPLNKRGQSFSRIWGQFTTRPSDFLAIRFAALAFTNSVSSLESLPSPVGAVNPTQQPDGSWAYLPYPQYTIPPDYVPGQLIPRSTSAFNRTSPGREVQNDYVFTFRTGPVDHRLLVGGVIREDIRSDATFSSGSTSTATSSPIDPINPTFPGSVFVNFDQPPVNYTSQDSTLYKGFVLDTLSLFKERLILTAGLSAHRFSQSSFSQSYNQITKVYSDPVINPETTLYKNLAQYSILVKPRRNISVFYGYNANFAANPIQFGKFLPPQQGKQWELGVKSSWLNERLNVSASYFDIQQSNNTIKAYPTTTPPSLLLVSGVNSKGIDGDISFSINSNLSLVATFAFFQASAALNSPWSLAPQPFDGSITDSLPVNDVSERNFSTWLRYKFTDDRFKGLSIGIGYNALAKRAITDNANNLLYGYLPGQGLVDMNINYETKHFKYSLRVDNLLNNRGYFHAVRSNQVILPGYPINIGGAITYKF
jgi:iron complex outermembrane receptor protein